MSKKSKTLLHPNGGSGWYMPITEDGKQHKDKKVLVKQGENTPDDPKFIDGKRVVDWIMVP